MRWAGADSSRNEKTLPEGLEATEQVRQILPGKESLRVVRGREWEASSDHWQQSSAYLCACL